MRARGTRARGDVRMRPRREHGFEHVVLGHERLHLYTREWMSSISVLLYTHLMIAAQRCGTLGCEATEKPHPSKCVLVWRSRGPHEVILHCNQDSGI